MSDLSYEEFLRKKLCLAESYGFDSDRTEVNPIAKPHQKDLVAWAVKGGRRAIFADFGLGKTMIQLEALRLILDKLGSGRALIIAPLGVRQEFFRDAEEKLDISIRFIRRIEEAATTGIYITNYETVRDGKLDPNAFEAVSLDEASVLRSYGSKTYQTFLTLFQKVRFKFVCTATPSPNRYKELIHYAGYLGIMDTGQALTRFFQRDSTKANNLTLYPHKEKEFWLWLSSWAAFVQRPSDLGHDDTGYDLPPLKVHYHFVKNTKPGFTFDRYGDGILLTNSSMGLKGAAKEKRDTLEQRIEKMVDLLRADSESHWLIWHDLEDERRAIKKAWPEAVEVYGTQELELREQRVLDFSDGKIKYLATKPILSGSGCNFQRFCNKAIFLGVGYKFNDFIQSCKRIHRFLQAKPCEIHIICSDDEKPILRVLQQKWARHNEMVKNMSEIIKEHGLANLGLSEALTRSIGCKRIESRGENYTAVNNDCVEETHRMESDSVDLIHTSIPFSNHYEYSPSYNDFGHTNGDEGFFAQMDFLTPELIRILKPGRVAAIHVKDRILFGNVTGYGMPTSNPFHAKCILHYQKHGFAYMGMITIVTDVVRENNQTYRLGWTEKCKDGTKMGVGSPEYVLLMRKLPTDRSDGFADERVIKSKHEYSRARWQTDAHAFWRSSGNRQLTPDELVELGPAQLATLFTKYTLENIYDYKSHVKIGEELDSRDVLPTTFMALAPGSHHPEVWTDINRMLTLNGEQVKRNLEAHICPLQFDIVDRIITRYSNPGEIVFDPFAGLMTVPYRAIYLGRRGYGIELHPQYFFDGVKYLEAAEREVSMPQLFDVIGA
jgi:DNA modification methylase